MGKIDITLRDIIQEIPPKFVQLLSGKKAKKLLDTSLPEVKERRADFLVELEDGSIFHLELQTQKTKTCLLECLSISFLSLQSIQIEK